MLVVLCFRIHILSIVELPKLKTHKQCILFKNKNVLRWQKTPSQTPHTLRPSSRHCRDPLLWVSQSHCEAMVALWSCLLGRSPPSTLVSFVVFLEWPSLLSLWLSLSLNKLWCIPCHCHCLWTTFVAFLANIPLARPLFLASDTLRLGLGPLICTISEVSEPIGNYPFVLSHYSLCCCWWSSIVVALGLVLAISFIHRRSIVGKNLLFLYNISLNIWLYCMGLFYTWCVY